MKINIVRPILPKLNNIKNDFDKCLNTGLVTNNGINVRKFEKNIKKFLKSKNDPVLFCKVISSAKGSFNLNWQLFNIAFKIWNDLFGGF